MRYLFVYGWVVVLGCSLSMGQPSGQPAYPGQVPSFAEVYQLLTEKLPHLPEEKLNQAAVFGLIEQLHPQVVLLPENEQQPGHSPDLLNHAAIYEETVGYIRVGQVESGLSQAIRSAHQELTSKKPFEGLVIDLRFAEGRDYRAAAEAAALFLDWETVLLRWKDSVTKSSATNRPIPGPVAVLVNEQTAGAAEVLAALLRQNQVGLIIGAPTAGEALQYEEFTLSTGQRLQIATTPIDAGEKSGLSAQGLAPDILVRVSLDQEREYLKDPYKVLAEETQRTRSPLGHPGLIRRTNGPDTAEPSRTEKPATPVLQDPVLARGVDLVKGLAVLKRGR
jgi:hypothetical protein